MGEGITWAEARQELVEHQEEISELDLINASRAVAVEYGEQERDGKHASEKHRFVGERHEIRGYDGLEVVFNQGVHGSEDVEVNYNGQKVFSARELVNSKPDEHQPVVEVENPEIETDSIYSSKFNDGQFQIDTYLPGETGADETAWQYMVNTLYSRITSEVPEEDREELAENFGI